MATNSSSPQYTFYLHKGLPALHLGAPADLFDTRRLVSGGQRGGLVAGRFVFGCRQSFFWLSAGCFLLPAGCCLALSAQTKPSEHKMVLRQISCCQVKQVWKILIQRSRSEARPYILLLIHFILLFRPSISPLLIEYFMAFLMGEMSRWTLFTKLTTSP